MYLHIWLFHFTQISVQKLPCPPRPVITYSKTTIPISLYSTALLFSLITCHCWHNMCSLAFPLSLPFRRMQMPCEQEFVLSFPVSPQHPEQSLLCSMSSINICGMNEWPVNSFSLRNLTKDTVTSLVSDRFSPCTTELGRGADSHIGHNQYQKRT